jgi:hypothetical protein
MTTLFLKNDEMAFIKHHKIPISYIFDGTGMSREEYRQFGRDNEKLVVLNVSCCKAHGHTMRTRTGACLQCSPAALVYLARHHKQSFVYIAGSKKGRVVKVGLSIDPTIRENGLNSSEYGGNSDWVMLFTKDCTAAGRVEADTHTLLSKHQAVASYIGSDKSISCCTEIFNCSYKVAVAAMLKASEGIKGDCWESLNISGYDFDVINRSAKESKTTPINNPNKYKPESKPHYYTDRVKRSEPKPHYYTDRVKRSEPEPEPKPHYYTDRVKRSEPKPESKQEQPIYSDKKPVYKEKSSSMKFGIVFWLVVISMLLKFVSMANHDNQSNEPTKYDIGRANATAQYQLDNH